MKEENSLVQNDENVLLNEQIPKQADILNSNENYRRQMDRDVVIVRDLKQIQEMYQNQNVMNGIKSIQV